VHQVKADSPSIFPHSCIIMSIDRYFRKLTSKLEITQLSQLPTPSTRNISMQTQLPDCTADCNAVNMASHRAGTTVGRFVPKSLAIAVNANAAPLLCTSNCRLTLIYTAVDRVLHSIESAIISRFLQFQPRTTSEITSTFGSKCTRDCA
jgi:hypothetical protein